MINGEKGEEHNRGPKIPFYITKARLASMYENIDCVHIDKIQTILDDTRLFEQNESSLISSL